MNDERLQELQAELVASRAAAGREACVAPDAIQALIERRGPEPERLATLDHVMACPHCRREFEFLRSVNRAAAADTRSPVPRGRLALAASILLLATATLIWRSTGKRPSPFRGNVDSVTVVAPRGDVPAGEPLSLIWHRVGTAVRYDVEILDDAGVPVFAASTRDTSVIVPDSVGIGIGTSYHWWVQATLGDLRTVRSATSGLIRR